MRKQSKGLGVCCVTAWRFGGAHSSSGSSHLKSTQALGKIYTGGDFITLHKPAFQEMEGKGTDIHRDVLLHEIMAG